MVRLRRISKAEAESARRDGRFMVKLTAPGWEGDEMFEDYAQLEEWNEYRGAWVRVEVVDDDDPAPRVR